VSERTALTLSSVFRAVSLVAGSVASLPLRTLEEQDEVKVRVSSFLDYPGGRDRQTTHEWKELVMTHLLLHGNSFLQHVYNGGGALTALNPIHPGSVSVEWDDTAIGGKLYTVTRNGAETVVFDGSQMTQIMALSLDGLVGISPITAARQSLATGLSGDRAANRMFSNGAMISGLVTPAGDEDLTEDEARTVKDSVNKTMTGTENAGDIAVINRRLQFTPWQSSAEDAQFLQSRAFQVDEVGRWFGVPPHLLGLTEKSTSWGQGIAEQNRGLARYTLTPWTARIEERCSRLLPPARSAEFDYTAFVKPSPEDEIRLLIEQVGAGLLTVDEARRVRNMPPLPAAQVAPRLELAS